MDAAQDELIMLAAKERFQPDGRPQIALFAQAGLVSEKRSGGNMELVVNDDIGRSCYLGQLPRILPVEVHEWGSHRELSWMVQEWARAHLLDAG